MRKSSGKAEFRRIAAELELAIRKGEYPERLDNIQQLMNRFDVAKQTISNALQLLRCHGIIEQHGRSGMIVDHSKLTNGVVGIIGTWEDDQKYQENYIYMQPAIVEMEKSGYSFVLLRTFSASADFLNKLELSGFAGFIFTGLALTETIAERLLKLKKPFVSTNRLPFFPDIDYVNFDTEKAVFQLASDLKDSGWKKIALLFVSNTDGYNQLLMKMWKKIKRELGLEILSCDRICHRDDLSWGENAVNYLRHIAAMPEKPEVMIHYGGYYSERIKSYKQAVPEYPLNMRIVHVAGAMEEHFNPDHIIFKNANSTELLQESFKILMERMRSPEAPKIHRLIPYNIEYLQKPDKK